MTALIPYVSAASELTAYDLGVSSLSDQGPDVRLHTLTAGTELALDPTLDDSVYAGHTYVCDGTGDRFSSFNAEATVYGTSPAGPTDRYHGFAVTIRDAAGVADWAVTGAVSNGGLIRLTVTGHGVETGDSVGVYGVTGTTEANGQWIVTRIDGNTVDLQGSTFSNAYVSGGTLTNRGSYYGALFGLIPTETRSGLTGTAQNGDDVVGAGVFNGGAVPATAAFQVNHNSAFGASREYYAAFSIEGNADAGLKMIGSYEWGIDLYGGGTADYNSGFMLIPNDSPVYGRNAADSGYVDLFRMNTGNALQISAPLQLVGNLQITDGTNIDLGNTNGTKIGLSATQKLGFFNATPIVRPTGVAVSAPGIHAALVSLGLIGA
jgi:antitoxin component of MazEF toxin-antitoxin module